HREPREPSLLKKNSSRRYELQRMAMPVPLSPRFALHRSEPYLDKPHHLVQQEADNADGQNAQQNVGVDQAVVLLPQKPADTRRARQHFTGNNNEPCDSKTKPVTGEDIRQSRR